MAVKSKDFKVEFTSDEFFGKIRLNVRVNSHAFIELINALYYWNSKSSMKLVDAIEQEMELHDETCHVPSCIGYIKRQEDINAPPFEITLPEDTMPDQSHNFIANNI